MHSTAHIYIQHELGYRKLCRQWCAVAVACRVCGVCGVNVFLFVLEPFGVTSQSRMTGRYMDMVGSTDAHRGAIGGACFWDPPVAPV